MIKRIALVVIVLILSLSTPVLAAEPAGGIIDGSLVNGTEGGSSVAGQEVTLKIYLNTEEVAATTATTDADGHFIFNGLDKEPGYGYQVELTFEQAEYSSDWVTFNEGKTTKSITVTVYDSTTSDEAITVAMSHRVIYTGVDTLEVKEYFLFVNDADRTYIGARELPDSDNRETLRFSLPERATGLQPDQGLMECCIFTSDEGFIDTMPLLPGAKEVTYSYQVDYNSGVYTFSHRINYPMVSFNLLIPGGGIAVDSDRLTREEPLDIEDTRFDLYTGSNFVPGDVLVVKLSGLPIADNEGTFLWVAIVLAVLTGSFGLVYLMRRKSLPPVPAQASPGPPRQQLLTKLARLDDDFAAGKIPEAVYRKRRAVTKARLVELMQELKEERDRS